MLEKVRAVQAVLDSLVPLSDLTRTILWRVREWGGEPHVFSSSACYSGAPCSSTRRAAACGFRLASFQCFLRLDIGRV